jgi:hypothetical protein
LCDVAPDGTSHLVAKGMLNGTRRNSHTVPEPLTPGEVYALEIQIDCTAWKFAAGHRVRLNIASADWPNVWPTPEAATNQVYFGIARPSRLVLPTVPAQGSATPPAFLPSQMSVSRFADALHPPTWEIITDVLSGLVTARIEVGREFRVNETTLIRRDNSVVCQVSPGDPANASARGRAMHQIIRPNYTVCGVSDMLVQATATHFHVTIDLNLYVNEALHFSKRWVESAPRCLL